MAVFDFLGLKKTLSSVRSRLASLDEEILALETRRSAMVRMPLPFDDYVQWVCDCIDDAGHEWVDALGRGYRSTQALSSHLATRPDGDYPADAFAVMYPEGKGITIPLFNPLVRGDSLHQDAAYIWIMRDQIKAGIRAAYDKAVRKDWPSDVGLPRAKRIAELAKLDAEIERLSREREGIATELASISAAA